MKRLTAILMALSLAFPAWAAAELDVNMEQKEENGQTLTVFSAEAGTAETTAAPEETPDPAIATANALIEARFEQAKAAQLTQRAGAIRNLAHNQNLLSPFSAYSTRSPRNVLSPADVIFTRTICPIRLLSPGKLTVMLYSFLPAIWFSSRRDDSSTNTLCT